MSPIKKFLFLFLAIIPLLLGGYFWLQFNVAQAETIYYVAKNGSDANPGTESQPFLTVHKGISVLTPGDTLYVKEGTYEEGEILNPPGGTSWENAVTIAAFPGDTVTLKPNTGAMRVFSLRNSNSQYIIIDGFIMDAANASHDALKIEYTNTADGPSQSGHIRVKNSEIKNAHNQGILVNGKSGNDGCCNEFINLNVHHNGTGRSNHGIYISTSDNLVENSLIHHNSGWGIHIWPGYSYIDNNIIRGNKIYDNNTTNQDGSGMIAGGEGTGHQVYNNIIYNTVAGTGQRHGIETRAGVEIYNNTIYGNNGNGILIYKGPDSIVKNNIMYANTNSAIVDNDVGTVISNNLTTDPLFVSEASSDFHLQARSSAIDAGVAISLVGDDYDDNTRPQGAAYDIGAYEFIPLSDSSPPQISITSPASGTTVPDTVTLTASASDNAAVTGVQFQLDGENIGTEDKTAPYSVNWYSTTAFNSAHTLTAIAYDAAGNQTISGAITVTVNNPVSSSLPSFYWKFDESSGTTADDSAGTRNGTLVNMDPATDWVAGRIGNALDFDGIDDQVNISNWKPQNSSFTLSAWFNLNVSVSAVNDIFPIFGNYQNTPLLGYRPTEQKFWHFRQYTGGGQSLSWTIGSLGNLADGQWHNVVLVVDQTNYTAKLYVDGTAYDGTKTIGTEGYTHGNGALYSLGRDYASSWSGKLDDLRVYNRTLTAAELAAVFSPPPEPAFDSTLAVPYMFLDNPGILQLNGSNFSTTDTYTFKLMEEATERMNFSSLTSTDTNSLNVDFTTKDLSSLAHGFYSIELVQTSDAHKISHSKQFLITKLGDIWAPSATDTASQKRDGRIDAYDVSRMLSKWGTADADADVNSGPENVSAGKVDLYDANKLMKNWTE